VLLKQVKEAFSLTPFDLEVIDNLLNIGKMIGKQTYNSENRISPTSGLNPKTPLPD